MNWIDTNTLIAICTCAIGLTQLFLWKHISKTKAYIEEKAKLFAQEEQIAVLTTIAEEAKNAVTKKDIEEITKKIESVKNEISFVKQRENEYLKERKESLLNFLNEISIFSIHKNRLEAYLYNYSATNDIMKFYEEFIKNSNKLCQTYNLLQVYFTDTNTTEEISNIYYTCMNYINKLYSILFRLINLALRSSYNVEHPTKENSQKIKVGIEALHEMFNSKDIKEIEDKYNERCIKCRALISILYELNFHQKISFLNREAN